MKVAVKLASIICHQETNGRGDDEVAAMFVIEPVGDPDRAQDAMAIDADVDSDDGSEEVDTSDIETSVRAQRPIMFNDLAADGLRMRLAGRELDGVGSSEALARTQFDDFKAGPLSDTRHDRLWDADFVVIPEQLERFLVDGVQPEDYGFSGDPLSATNRWDKASSVTAHQHLVFTNSDEGSEYELVIGYQLEYEEPDPDPLPFPFPFPLPFPFPFPFGRL